jgi:hypothetical protein
VLDGLPGEGDVRGAAGGGMSGFWSNLAR